MSYFVTLSLPHPPFKIYQSSHQHLNYMKRNGIFLLLIVISISLFLFTSKTIKKFMLFHVNPRAMSTLPTVLSALSHFHSKNHIPSPTTSRSVIRALKGNLLFQTKYSLPIIWQLLLLSPTNLHAPLYSYVQSGESLLNSLDYSVLMKLLTCCCWTSIGFDIFIRKSKTDQHAKGDYVSIARNSNPLLCPVSLTILYLKRLKITSGFLLPSHKGRLPDPNSPLVYSTALRDLLKCLSFVNIDGFGEHSWHNVCRRIRCFNWQTYASRSLAINGDGKILYREHFKISWICYPSI